MRRKESAVLIPVFATARVTFAWCWSFGFSDGFTATLPSEPLAQAEREASGRFMAALRGNIPFLIISKTILRQHITRYPLA
jgi:hypothetical protein